MHFVITLYLKFLKLDISLLLFLQMTICTKQSMQLHRESIDNLHSVVDSNVKVTKQQRQMHCDCPVRKGLPFITICTELYEINQVKNFPLTHCLLFAGNVHIHDKV